MTRYFLVNRQGLTFDSGDFDSDAEAARWGAGRGGSYDLITWGPRGSDRLVASWRDGRRYHSPYEDFRGHGVSRRERPGPSYNARPRDPKGRFVRSRNSAGSSRFLDEDGEPDRSAIRTFDDVRAFYMDTDPEYGKAFADDRVWDYLKDLDAFVKGKEGRYAPSPKDWTMDDDRILSYVFDVTEGAMPNILEYIAEDGDGASLRLLRHRAAVQMAYGVTPDWDEPSDSKATSSKSRKAKSKLKASRNTGRGRR